MGMFAKLRLCCILVQRFHETAPVARFPSEFCGQVSLRAQRSNLPEGTHLTRRRLLRCTRNDMPPDKSCSMETLDLLIQGPWPMRIRDAIFTFQSVAPLVQNVVTPSASPPEVAIDAEVDLGPVDGAYALAARLDIRLPGVAHEAAHQTCPYRRYAPRLETVSERGHHAAPIAVRRKTHSAAWLSAVGSSRARVTPEVRPGTLSRHVNRVLRSPR